MRVDLWINEDAYLTWAAQYFANLADPAAAKTADADYDGFANEQEFAAGTNPLNAASALRLANCSRAADGASFSLNWASVTGKTYQVETSATLLAASWVSIGSSVVATGASSTLTVPMNASDGRRFFRVRVMAP